jgi:hypothetical protein
VTAFLLIRAIGFDLAGAPKWIRDNGWEGLFDFSAAHDYGFVRYPFPGKAHVDYWNDGEVFGHFIETVVKEPVSRETSSRTVASTGEREAPRTLRLKKVRSLVTPYLGVAALVFIGVYVLYKAIDGALRPDEVMSFGTTSHLVVAVTLLLLGVTVASRVPRLTRNGQARFVGVAIAIDLVGIGIWLGEGMGAGPDFVTKVSSEAYMAASFVLTIVAIWATARRPSWGLKPLILVGTAAIAAFVGLGLWRTPTEELGPLWPVFLAMAVFLYPWWLAALILDLVLIWHLLIHSPSRAEVLKTMAGVPRQEQAAV